MKSQGISFQTKSGHPVQALPIFKLDLRNQYMKLEEIGYM